MAREATARLYDVDDNGVKYIKPDVKGKYDIGTVSFRPRKNDSIDLSKLFESIWATRLSRGTRSGVVSLEVTINGSLEKGDSLKFRETSGVQEFTLVDDTSAKPREPKKSQLAELKKAVASGEQIVSVTGYVDGWKGGWVKVLSQPLPKETKLMVTGYEAAKGGK